MAVEDIISWVTTVCTIGVSLIGFEICAKIARKGSPGDISFIPFLIMFISACLWLKYGLLRRVFTVVFVNSVAALLQGMYMCIYYTYSLQRGHLNRLLFFGIVFLLLPLSYIRFYLPDESSAIDFLGRLCCIISIFSYGSPLASVFHVVRTKSTECMSFPLATANFVVALEWFFYGALLKDFYMQMPNMCGVLLCLFQFALFFKYPAKPQPILSIKA
ncbi:sugar transporter SWEET1 isoform X1 [Octopus bimaculoides]|uniref:Sugar transporter SWEET1 n=1 Tax=Octopus bimaculoides TaxID=37653 RepID=A0A0L8G9N5_OCTBM|nr:sugar transporter SWEET1 isoform X1 [Octopus bimaculoides]|eukprot:XP_014782928.1 PREDICTED: sugar transporter SWEET1-like isoform X1 [Octopus bimaculoides]